MTYHHFELHALKHNNFSKYEQLKTYRIGASLTGRRSTVDREITIHCGLMRVGYSTSVQAADDFILNIHTLAKPWRALKNRMKLKTSCNHKEFSHGQKKMIEQYIQQ